jgi:flagellar biosynthesis GTPase FlhF
MRVLFLMLLALAPCALAQKGQNPPAVSIPNQPLSLPTRTAPGIDQPGGALPGPAGGDVNQLNLRTIPIEDAVAMMFMLISADAQEDLQDMLEDMARTREEREALRRKYRQARHEAREHDRERREQRRALRAQMRDEAREKREERREALREAREKSREEARDRREQLREKRAALRKEMREARRRRHEALHVYYEARARQGLLAAGLVSSVMDQFNAPDGPQPQRVGILLDQIDAQAARLKDPPPEGASDNKDKHNDNLLAAHLGELRSVWKEFVAATGNHAAQASDNLASRAPPHY